MVIQFLRSTGLKDIAFSVVNAKEATAGWPQLSQLARQTGIRAYQETERAPVWSWLNGSAEDMFIYDRYACSPVYKSSERIWLPFLE